MGVNSSLLREDNRRDSHLLEQEGTKNVHLHPNDNRTASGYRTQSTYSSQLVESSSAYTNQWKWDAPVMHGRWSKQAKRRMEKAAQKTKQGIKASAPGANVIAGYLREGYDADESGADGSGTTTAVNEAGHLKTGTQKKKIEARRAAQKAEWEAQASSRTQMQGAAAQAERRADKSAQRAEWETQPQSRSRAAIPNATAQAGRNASGPEQVSASLRASKAQRLGDKPTGKPAAWARMKVNQVQNMRRSAAQAAWRETTKRKLASQSAMSSAQAAKASASAKTTGSVASKLMASVTAGASTGGMLFLPVLALLTLFFAMMMTFVVIDESNNRMLGGNGGEALASWAIKQYDDGAAAGHYYSGGEPYWSFAGFSGRVEWCSCFVMKGWHDCGFDETITRGGTPWANSWLDVREQADNAGTNIMNTSSYVPKPGDIIVRWPPGHVGIVVSELDESGRFRVIEGNYSDRVASNYYYPGQRGFWDEIYRPNYPDTPYFEGEVGPELGEGINFNISEEQFVQIWAPAIDQYYADKNPNAPLNGHGEAFARSAYRGKMDPRWLPIIGWYESNGGLAVPGYAPYNCYGWGVTDSGPSSVANAADGYDRFIAFILENAGTRANGWGGAKVLNEYTSLRELDDTYCSSSAARIDNLYKDLMKITPQGAQIGSTTNFDDTILIGDSLMVESRGYLQNALPNVTVDAAYSRSFLEGGTGDDPASGIYARAAAAAGNYKRIVIGMGNNDYEGVSIDEGEALVAAVGDSHVYLIKMQSTGNQTSTANTNATIDALAAAHRNVHVIDWHAVAEAHPEYLRDTCHQTEPGRHEYVSCIAKGLGASTG